MEKNPLLFSILVGFLITLGTSLLTNVYVVGEFPDISFVSIPLLGMSYWGFPLPWIKQVIYPGAVKEIVWSHMFIDIIFWSASAIIAKAFHITVVKGEKLEWDKLLKGKKAKKK